MRRTVAAVGLAVLTISSPLWADSGAQLSTALAQVRISDWAGARASVAGEGQITRDIVEWHRLRKGLGSAQDTLDFLERNPDWPGLALLRRKSEPAMDQAGTQTILTYYAQNPPTTAEGVLSHARALRLTRQDGDAEASIVLAWRTLPMGSKVQEQYLRDHKALITPHHAARLDRMLWDNHKVSARRMLPLVSKDQRLLAEARLALMESAPGVDTRIEAVPEALQNDPGLAHARFLWRMRKGRIDDAALLLQARSQEADLLGEPDAWARKRRDLARQVMRNNDAPLAYELAARHGLTQGSSYADLEWLAGYIALRQLGDPETALRHFQRFDAAVASPISKGRSGYWRGRAHAALGDTEAAQLAYDQGAAFQTSFYGLLAAEKLGRSFDPILASPPVLPDWRSAPFMESTVLEAALLLLRSGETALAERFLAHMVETLPDDQAQQLGQMAIDMQQPHLAVMIGKRAARTGRILPAAYYPLHPVAEMSLTMAPEMTLAIARRESEFDPVVISGAGARGLMQVMPQTARLVAQDMGLIGAHTTQRLITEWRYNAQLGATYLSELSHTFAGNVVMMAAGYNAGPGRPTRWMEVYGDPRAPDGPDIVDWIEFIPFNETRNYVMRVTESLPVYRARLGQEALPIPFSRELVGQTLLKYAIE